MPNNSLRLRTLVAGFAIVLVLTCAVTNLAQSGRRVRKSEPVPVSTPEPEPSPSSSVSREKPKPRYIFTVGLDRNDLFANLPMYAYEGVLKNFVDRLEESPVVQVGGAQSNMSRGEAIQKAKADREGYVIYLQLALDTMSNNTQNSSTPDIIIEYAVLAPVTGKQVTYGRTYSQSQRGRGGILNPRPSSVYGDRYVNQAAQEAADKVMAYFRSHGPSTPPPTKVP